MSLDVLFYNGKDEEDGVIIGFGNDGFKELIQLGLFKIPHCTATDGKRAIDLKIFCVKVENIINACKIAHPQQREIIKSIKDFRYLASLQ